jgi:RNA polymerase sigma-70 factor, ECF subfamily
MLTMGIFTRQPAIPAETDALLQSARTMDGQALAEVHDRYYPAVRRYVGYRLGDPEVVEDIVADTFLHLLDGLQKRGGQIRDLRAYLLGTAANLVNDHLRRRYRRGEQNLAEEHEEIAGDGSPEQDSTEHSHQQAVRQALARLTADQQNVLALRFSQELSLDETAVVMGKSIGAVKVLQFRAIASLRRLLLDEDRES